MEIIFSWLIGIFKNLILHVIELILTPIDLFLQNHIPNLSELFLQVTQYLNDYFFKGLQFVKMVFFNLTNVNGYVWGFFLTSLIVMIYVSLNFIFIKFALNVWRLIHGNNGGKKSA